MNTGALGDLTKGADMHDLGVLDLENLAFGYGGDVLVRRALAGAAPGARLVVRGRAVALDLELGAWCRSEGYACALRGERSPSEAAGEAPSGAVREIGHVVTVTAAATARLRGALRAGGTDASVPEAVVAHASPTWGLAARGALVEAGLPAFPFSLVDKDAVWSDDAGRLYAQAAAAQWDPETAIPWAAPRMHAPELEAALVQVLTYLIENETVALLVPARFLARIHPHFREVMQLLAVQAADEARHIEVFTRRARLGAGAAGQLGFSSRGGQLSLRTLLDEPDFALAQFLLAVLGEGTFLSLLHFLHDVAPDPTTAAMMKLAAQDEARHVAFGLSHLRRHLDRDSGLRPRLTAAVELRHEGLRHTTGLNQDVFDALVLLAAGSLAPLAIGAGHARVMGLVREMAAGRKLRLERLGFTLDEAERLAALHTRNFM